MLLNIGVGCNDLVLGGQLSALLELKITDSTREGKVAVHSAEVDKTTSSCDSVLLI